MVISSQVSVATTASMSVILPVYFISAVTSLLSQPLNLLAYGPSASFPSLTVELRLALQNWLPMNACFYSGGHCNLCSFSLTDTSDSPILFLLYIYEKIGKILSD